MARIKNNIEEVVDHVLDSSDEEFSETQDDYGMDIQN